MEMEESVIDRYTKGAAQVEPALCCPVTYDAKLLERIPKEIIDKDYGCGDPTPYLKEGDIVLDLGSGAGKICYMAAQIVGPKGKVIGIDMNDQMLSLARKYQGEFAQSVGFDNVSFLKGKIQDLSLNLASVDEKLKKNPIRNSNEWIKFQHGENEAKANAPLIGDHTIDCIVSNCVLNLVNESQKRDLFVEMFRVLKRGGRIAISDIVADEPIPDHLKKDPKLWSGCISGSMTETGFLKAFEEAGFYGISIAKRDETPWQIVEGIEFRSVVVLAYKGKQGECWDHNESVIYKGPFKQVSDDDGHIYYRGQRMAVCKKTFEILKSSPYQRDFCFIDPRMAVSKESAKPFDCNTGAIRSPSVTKGANYSETKDASECYVPESKDSSSCC